MTEKKEELPPALTIASMVGQLSAGAKRRGMGPSDREWIEREVTFFLSAYGEAIAENISRYVGTATRATKKIANDADVNKVLVGMTPAAIIEFVVGSFQNILRNIYTRLPEAEFAVVPRTPPGEALVAMRMLLGLEGIPPEKRSQIVHDIYRLVVSVGMKTTSKAVPGSQANEDSFTRNFEIVECDPKSWGK